MVPRKDRDGGASDCRPGDAGQLDRGQGDVVRRVVGSKDLARFQAQATQSISNALADPHPAGRIVTAGTGSGKTLAFYLPAILDIAARADVPRTGPHTLALYPRNELLRDQARETLRMLENLGPLNGPASRSARIGLLYGNTPNDAKITGTKTSRAWKREDDGWVTPYFPCLDDSELCGGCRDAAVRAAGADEGRQGRAERFSGDRHGGNIAETPDCRKARRMRGAGLPRRCAPRNDGLPSRHCERSEAIHSSGAWRMGWDSNPRWACTHGGFQDRCLKPLGHPSGDPEIAAAP